MDSADDDREPARLQPATLGDVLYARPARHRVGEQAWIALVHSIAAGDQGALHTLYLETHRLVFTLSMRITHSSQTAEEVTLDVYHDVWRRAAAYDPAAGSVVGWIMNQARSRAIDRLRFDGRKKRVMGPIGEGGMEAGNGEPSDTVRLQEQARILREALTVLSADERHAIQTAFFSGLTHGEVAIRLDEPLGTVKTRIRSALGKLREALAAGGKEL